MNEFVQRYLQGGNCAQLGEEGGVPSVEGLFCVIGNSINLLLVFAGAVALMFLIYGGFQYILSGGDEKSLLIAKNTITFAILGLVITLGTLVGINLLFSIIGLR